MKQSGTILGIVQMGDTHEENSTKKFLGEAGQTKPILSYPMGSDVLLNMGKETEKLLIPLTAETQLNVDQWLDRFQEFIENPENRMIYSYISNVIFKLEDPPLTKKENQLNDNQSPTDILSGNIYIVVNKAKMRLDEAKKAGERLEKPRRKKQTKEEERCLLLYKSVVKLNDHINLAMRQREQYNRSAELQAEKAKLYLEKDMADLSKDLTSQLVGLISLFTALSFVVFGGISSLENIIEIVTKQTVPLLRTAFVGVIWMFAMGNLLFAFMYFILCVIGKKTPLSGDKNLVKDYPMVFLGNYICLIIFIVLGLYFISCKIGFWPLFSDWPAEVIGVAFLILSGFLVWGVYFIGKKIWVKFK